MGEGFIADQGYGVHVVPSWVEGRPEKSVWTGVKLSGRARSAIATWRCRRCGYLESYASNEPDRSEEARTRSQTRLVLVIALLAAAITFAIALGFGLRR